MLKVKRFLMAGTFLLTASPAFAQVGQLGNDGYFYIRDNISPRTRYQVELAGTPTTRAIQANACGMIVLRPSAKQPFSNGERFEITDSAAGKTYALANTNLPIKISPKCNNGQLETSDIPPVWKTSEGAIAIRNLTPNGAITLKRLDRNSQRTIASNDCGFLRIKLPSSIPSAIFFNGVAFSTTGEASVPGVQCKKGVLYERYPRPPVIAGVPEATWKQQNSTAGTPGAIALSPTSSTPQPSPSPSPQPTAQYVYIPAPPPGKSSCTSESGTSVSFSGLQPNRQYTAYDTEVDVLDTKTSNSQGVVVFGFSQDIRQLTWEGEPDQIEIVAGDDNSIGNNPVRRIGVTGLATCTLYPINQEGQIIKINPDGSVEVVKI
jgi:hypothetical protein